MLFVLQVYNMGTTPPHMKVNPIYWDPPNMWGPCGQYCREQAFISRLQLVERATYVDQNHVHLFLASITYDAWSIGSFAFWITFSRISRLFLFFT